MQFHVVYQAGEVNHFGSNIDTWDFTVYKPSWLAQHPGITVVTWQLNDLPLTRKWVEVFCNKMRQTFELKKKKKPYVWRMIYDVYVNPTVHNVLQSRSLMNSTIDWLNQCAHTANRFSTDLMLDPTNLENTHIDRLNRLHELFETEMDRLTNLIESQTLIIEQSEWNQLWMKLQTVNMIVHFNEKLNAAPAGQSIREFLQDQPSQYFTALKWEEPHNSFVGLEPSDYQHFTLCEPAGTLWLDFGTVGKDLYHCYCTNDHELIQQRMVSPQRELKPWVSYGWEQRSDQHAQETLAAYEHWLNKHYYDSLLDVHNNPQYTPGRHPLGQCVSHDIQSPADFVNQIISKTAKIRCFYLTDDQGNSMYV